MKGLFYSYQRNGQWVVCMWPKKTCREPTPDEEVARQRFKQVCEALKRMHPSILYYFRMNSWGTPMLPRDALMAMIYGKGPVIVRPNGEKVRPMASRLDMSMLLDNLAWKPGSILWRDENTWVGLDAGAVGQVLTVNHDTGFPEWRDPAKGGSGGWSVPARGSMNSSYQGGCLGSDFFPLIDFKLRRVVVRHNFPATASVEVVIARFTAGNVVEAVLLRAPFTGIQDGVEKWSVIDLPVEVDCDAEKWHTIFICNKAGWVGTNVIIGRGSRLQPQMPVSDSIRSRRKYGYPVNVGDTIVPGTEGFSIGWEIG